MIRVSNIKAGLDGSAGELRRTVERLTGWRDIVSFRIAPALD